MTNDDEEYEGKDVDIKDRDDYDSDNDDIDKLFFSFCWWQ
jgi:hypothetical protein